MPASPSRSALRNAVPYIVIGLLWIVLTDQLLLWLFAEDPVRLSEWQTIKRWIFVGLSSGIVYLLLYREHRARADLQQRTRELDTIVQHASDFIVRFGPDLRHLFVNQALSEAVGIPVEEYIGKTNEELGMEPEQCAFWNEHLRAVFDTGEPRTIEFAFTTREGLGYFQSRIVPEYYGGDHVETVVSFTRDITRLKETEAEMREAKEVAERTSELQAAFLASMSHEIRTPLTSILGFAEVVRDEVHEPELQSFIDLIQRNSRRLYETLNSVLDVARLEAGNLQPDLEERDVVQVVRDAVRLVEPRAEAKGLEVQLDLPEAPVWCKTDAPMLHRVVTNLATNAIKFTSQGCVTVQLAVHDGRLRLRVSDTGCGIDEAFLPHLFEAFYQESTGHGRLHEGSGLGLTITRHLTEVLGGTISVETEKGRGSTFTVELPGPARPGTAEREEASERLSRR